MQPWSETRREFAGVGSSSEQPLDEFFSHLPHIQVKSSFPQFRVNTLISISSAFGSTPYFARLCTFCEIALLIFTC